MAVSFRIFPRRGLVYVRYDGFADMGQTSAVFADYLRHPDYRPGQKQLVDLAGVTGYSKDYGALLQVQAEKAGAFFSDSHQTLIAYHAPDRLSLEMARLVLRSWDDIGSVIATVLETEAEALSVLGLAETSFEELMQVSD